MAEGVFRRAAGASAVVVATVLAVLGPAGVALGQTERYEDRKLVSADPVGRYDQLGYGVALQGSRLFAGAPLDETRDQEGGSVYEFDTNTGLQVGKYWVPGSNATSSIGSVIAVGGDLLLAGEPYNDDRLENEGAVHLFDISTGDYLGALRPGDQQADLHFGCALAIDGPYAVIGAKGDNQSTGAAYVFDTTTGQQVAKLTPSDGDVHGFFGQAIALDSDRPAVFIATTRTTVGTGGGAVYVFNPVTGAELGKIVPADDDNSYYFGVSVDVRGDRVVVGSTDADNRRGAAYVFDSWTGEQVGKILSPAPTGSGHFGGQVRLSDRHIVVCQPGNDNDILEIGRAFAFDRTTLEPVIELLQTDPPDAVWGTSDDFAKSIAIEGSVCVMGARTHRQDEGAVYLYDFAPRTLGMSGQIIADAGGDPVHLQITAAEAGTYHWRMDGVELEDDALYSGTHTRRLTVQPRLSTEGSYDVEMTNSLGESVSPAIVLGVRQPCLADVNGDGVADVRDVLAFLSLWSAGCP